MRTILLDRDGVINENRADHVKSWAEFRFLPGVLDALRLLSHSDFQIFVITNQAIINRNIVSRAAVEGIHQRMVRVARRYGACIQAIRYCPASPRRAVWLPQALAGHAAGTGADVGVRPAAGLPCGRRAERTSPLATRWAAEACWCIQAGGAQQAALPQFAQHQPAYCAPHLLRAAQWVLEQEGLTLTPTKAPQRERIAVSSVERENWR